LLADQDRKTGLVRLVQYWLLLTQHIFLWFGEKQFITNRGSQANATMHSVLGGLLIQGIHYCCFITGDFATAASQNVFTGVVLISFPFIGKTNIFQK
jgi:hypothetical protein